MGLCVYGMYMIPTRSKVLDFCRCYENFATFFLTKCFLQREKKCPAKVSGCIIKRSAVGDSRKISPILRFFLEITMFFFGFLLDPLRGPDFSDPPKTSARNFLTAFWFLSFDKWMSQKHSWHLPVFGHVLRWCSRLNHDKSITIWGEYFEHTFSHHFHSANLSRFTHLHSGTNKTCKNDDFLRWN